MIEVFLLFDSPNPATLPQGVEVYLLNLMAVTLERGNDNKIFTGSYPLIDTISMYRLIKLVYQHFFERF